MNWNTALVASAAATLAGAFALAACGGDECTRADDHFAECVAATISEGSSSSSSGEPPAQDCSGARLCHARCVNNHTCTQITSNDQAYLDCMAPCLGQ